MYVEVGSCPDVVCPPVSLKAPSYIHLQSFTGSQEIAFTAVTHLIPCIYLHLHLHLHHHHHLTPLFIFHAVLPTTGGNIVPECVRLHGCLGVKEKKNPFVAKNREEGSERVMGGGELEEESIKRKRRNEKSPLSQEESSAWSRVSSGFLRLERLLCKQQNADGRGT